MQNGRITAVDNSLARESAYMGTHLLRPDSGSGRIKVAGDGQWETARTKQQHDCHCLVLRDEDGPVRLTKNGGPHAALQSLHTARRGVEDFCTAMT
jgi:hypothetical protein